MEVHKKITADFIKQKENLIKNAPLLVLDANLTIEALETALEIANSHRVPVLFEPTDLVISEKPFKTKQWNAIKYISPNVNELKHISKTLGIIPDYKDDKLSIEEIAHLAKLLAGYIDNVIVTMGSNGLLIARYADAKTNLLSYERGTLQVRHYPINVVQKLVNVSGAGDCLVAAIISSMLNGLNEESCVAVGFQAALSSLQVPSAVPARFEIDDLTKPAKYIRIV